MSIKFQVGHHTKGGDNNGSSLKSIYFKGNREEGVFLVHGLTGTPNEMLFLADHFHKEGYSSFCPVLYKHGRPLKVLKHCSWEDFYYFLKKDFMEFKDSLPSRKVFVGGLSMGALLSLLLAYDFPNDIAGVMVLAPTLFYDGWNMSWARIFLPFVYLTPLKYCFYFKEETPYGIKSMAIRQYVENYYRRAGLEDLEKVDKYGYPFIPVSLMYQLSRLAKYLVKRIGSIKMPVQIIQAENDDLASVKNSQFIYQRIGSDDKEMLFLKDSYHVITADKERGKVFSYMKKFVFEHSLC